MSDYLARAEQEFRSGDLALGYQLLVPALREDPVNPAAWYLYGAVCEGISVHGLKGQPKWWASAVAAMTRANALNPGHAMTLTALGWNLHLAGRAEEAKARLEEAVAAHPGLGVARSNLAHVLCTLGEDEESLRQARLGVDLDPVNPICHLALAFALFFNGHWDEGWRWFEARIPLKMPEMKKLVFPRWDGKETGTVLLRAEQGLGDSIMMFRYLDSVLFRAERVVLQVQRALASLVRQYWPEVEVEAMPCPMPVGDVDAWCPLMSLPQLGLEPAKWAYIGERVEGVVSRETRRVGLVWAGDPAHDNDVLRSIPLVDLLPLTEVMGSKEEPIEFVSLQVGPRGTDELTAQGAHGLIRDLAPGLMDMKDTLREVEKLDLLISVDTAAAHLAGAAGCPVWLLINQRGGDWRWGHGVAQTIWYPQHRILRRAVDEQWSDLIRWLKEELTEWAR